MIDGVEIVSPSTESVERILNSHTSDTVKHITANERTSWNSKLSNIVKGNEYITVTNNNTVSVNVATTLSSNENTVPTTKAVYSEFENYKKTQQKSDMYIKNIVGNGDFVFNNYDPTTHTLGNH